jgi:hypothetical protein
MLVQEGIGKNSGFIILLVKDLKIPEFNEVGSWYGSFGRVGRGIQNLRKRVT